jgi:transmembrane sensor
MNKDRFIELITKELIGELSPDEALELNALIKNNHSYAKERNTFRMYWESDSTDQSDDHALFQQISAKIREQEPDFNIQQVGQTKRNFAFIWKAAAILFILSTSLYIYRSYVQRYNKPVYQLLTTVSGKRKIVTLSDGTIVTINSDSKLSFPSNFSDSTREVFLTGEAFFDVHKDHKHPFIIHTGKMNIRVLGTAFNVKAYPNDRFSETTLIRGIIQVTLTDRPADRITLKPTEKLIVNYLGGRTNEKQKTLQKANSLPQIVYLQKRDSTIVETSWLQNKLIFKDQDFETLSNTLERRYNVSFQFVNEETKQLRFTGIFEKETIIEVLDALQLTEGFRYKKTEDKILIY